MADRVERVAVIGLGTMGHGIAQSFAAAGCHVVGYDDMAAAAASAKARIARNLRQFADAGLVDDADAAATLDRVSIVDTVAEAVANADFVIEAVREDLPTKIALLAEIEPIVSDATIIASNSSTFPISQSGELLRRPERALVAHWFNPPHIVPTVEVVPSPATSETTIERTIELLARSGKVPVRLNLELPGFLVNRVQIALFREVWDLLRRGVASPDQIDAAIQGSMGFRLAALGPLQVQDFGGLDVQTTVYRNLVPEIASGTAIPLEVQRLVDTGDLGVKSGRGFFDYAGEGAGRAVADRDRKFLALLAALRSAERAGSTGSH